MLKLEVGKKYLNRQGDVVEIVDIADTDTFDRRYAFVDSNGESYTEDGLYDYRYRTDIDLISEYVQEIEESDKEEPKKEKLFKFKELKPGVVYEVVSGNEGFLPAWTGALATLGENFLGEVQAMCIKSSPFGCPGTSNHCWFHKSYKPKFRVSTEYELALKKIKKDE